MSLQQYYEYEHVNPITYVHVYEPISGRQLTESIV